MTDKLKLTIEKEIKKLPKEKKDVILASNWGNITEEIAKKFQLNESETNNLCIETLLVLVGIQSMDFYVVNIENEVGISNEEAIKIVGEVNQKIFTPIYEKLTENIKKDIKNRNPDWKQSIDFILSGGDYAALMDTNQIEELKK